MAMQQANRVKKALDGGNGPSFGCWQMLPGTNVSRSLARTGVDWVLVDCEHGNIDDAAMHEAVAAVAACGVSPIVRIPDNQGWMVKRALDCGAHGIMVPLINNAKEAEGLIKSAKFPPVGLRGFGSPFPMEAFDASLGASDYLTQANDAILTIVQIETAAGLENVQEIAAVPGIDVLFVGPFDLGNNIGHPITGGQISLPLKEAVGKILKATKAAGKKGGMFCTDGVQASEYAAMGFDFICVGVDMALMMASIKQALATAKGTSATGVTGPYGR